MVVLCVAVTSFYGQRKIITDGQTTDLPKIAIKAAPILFA